jgi:hypothetical protein
MTKKVAPQRLLFKNDETGCKTAKYRYVVLSPANPEICYMASLLREAHLAILPPPTAAFP